jgi:hypothetical protein
MALDHRLAQADRAALCEMLRELAPDAVPPLEDFLVEHLDPDSLKALIMVLREKTGTPGRACDLSPGDIVMHGGREVMIKQVRAGYEIATGNGRFEPGVAIDWHALPEVSAALASLLPLSTGAYIVPANSDPRFVRKTVPGSAAALGDPGDSGNHAGGG